MKSIYRMPLLTVLSLMVAINFSCKKFIEIDPPRTDLVKSAVFTSDATAEAAVIDIYYSLNMGFASGSTPSINFCGSLSSDELVYFGIGASSAQDFQQFNDHTLQGNNYIVGYLWSSLYTIIYKSNAVIEGLTVSAGVNQNLKSQLIGEVKFIRAFCYFQLVNLWGDAPLILSTDYKVNNVIGSTSKAEIYQQIIADLKDAQSMLPQNYSHAFNSERVRANHSTATALLSRAYLYMEAWQLAEEQSGSVISNTDLYGLAGNLDSVFYKDSREAILQLPNTYYPDQLFTFYIFSSPRSAALRTDFIGGFENNDNRKTQWTGSIVVNGITYFFPKKYKSFVQMLEYSTVFRLAEQYLIRAEARARQGKITGPNSAESDINMIRNRAGLGNTMASTQTAMFDAIEQERKFELFTEWGLRWLDLKRTNKATTILGPIKPNWQPYKELLPIPEAQLINDPNMTQNQGY